uniref:Uncharacterized protein n=1 Tax=Ectopseudomonas oleovorans TaxID=301 RepID=A0A653B4Q9_ECTOL
MRCVPAGYSLRTECGFTHRSFIPALIPRLLQNVQGRLSTRFGAPKISLMNVTKALILLGHLHLAMWITRSWLATMAAVFARRLDRG